MARLHGVSMRLWAPAAVRWGQGALGAAQPPRSVSLKKQEEVGLAAAAAPQAGLALPAPLPCALGTALPTLGAVSATRCEQMVGHGWG